MHIIAQLHSYNCVKRETINGFNSYKCAIITTGNKGFIRMTKFKSTYKTDEPSICRSYAFISRLKKILLVFTRVVFIKNPKHYILPGIALLLTAGSFKLIGQNTVVPFAVRYQADQRGGIVYVANNILSCNNSCNAVNYMPPTIPANTLLDDNDFLSKYIDIDNDATTFSSSSANLSLPNCSQITFAGLYWGGAVSSANSRYSIRNKVKLKLPQASGYTDITADVNFGLYVNKHYQYYKNITSLINPATQNGTYTLANVVANENVSDYDAGWTIVIVYKNEFKPFRNLTVFDGFAGITSNTTTPLDLIISGFLTPPVGPVKFDLGYVAYEGDRGKTGDILYFNNVQVSDALHTANNIFNSSITNNGTMVTTRNPSHNNTLGFDASIMMPDNTNLNYITNSATSANVSLRTVGDTYAVGVITTAIDIFSPYFNFTHEYINQTSPGTGAVAGDVLELIYKVENIGNDKSTKSVILDDLPTFLHFVPGSLQIEGVGRTDRGGDDQAEYDSVAHKVTFRVGTGSNATNGGNIEIGSTIRVRCLVKVTDDCDELRCSFNSFSNDGYISYYGNINNGAPGTNLSGPAPPVGQCFVSGQMQFNIDVPPSCLISPPNRVDTISCETLVTDLNLPAGFSLYDSVDINFQTPLSRFSEAKQYVAGKVTKGGCRYRFNIDVAVDPLAVGDTVTNIICNGTATGNIKIGVTGGKGTYVYSWTGPSGFTSTQKNIQSLQAGNYTVTATDSKGCTAIKTLTVSEQPILELAFTKTDINCFDARNGTATALPTGGKPPYTYSWNTNPARTTASVTELSPGAYTVTVADSLGCIKSGSISITEPPKLLLNTSRVDVSCKGGNNGSATLRVTGGTPPYIYRFNNNSLTTQNTASNLAAGTYSLTVIDALGCEDSTLVTVAEPDEVVLTATYTNASCASGANGTATVVAKGGTGSYTYSWNTNPSQNTATATGLTAGSYIATVTDAKGCIKTANVSIINPAPLSISGTQLNNDCFGENEGLINITVSGGVSPYTYSWSSGETSEDISTLSAGTYMVTVTDLNGCTAAKPFTITQPVGPLTVTYTIKDLFCCNGSDGSIDISVSGGTAPYSYKWTNGSETQDISNLGAGLYGVIVTDAAACTKNVSIKIDQPLNPLTVTTTKTDARCAGGANGTATAVATGGTGSYTYSWNTNPIQNGATANGLTAGGYMVTVKDVKGCITITNVTIAEPPPLSIAGTQRNIDCFGATDGLINVSVSGGVSPYTYSWSFGQISKDVSTLSAGTYIVTVSDANGCEATKSFTITQPAGPLTVTQTHKDLLCYGGLNGSIDISVSGGRAPYYYKWTNGSTSQDISNLGAGLYGVTVTDATGCTQDASIQIDQPLNPLTVIAIKSDVKCAGSATGSISLQVTGGKEPYKYLWSNNGIGSSIKFLIKGKYSVTVTDANGCTVNYETDIEEPNILRATVEVTPTVCKSSADGIIKINASGAVKPYTYKWLEFQNLNVSQINNLKAGTYHVVVSAASGCNVNLTIIVKPGNCNPVAIADNFNIVQEDILKGSVVANDSDPDKDQLTFKNISEPENGTLTFNSNGKFTFTPDKLWFGTTSFKYSACDGSLCSETEVSITVNKKNFPPIAKDDQYEVLKNTTLTIPFSGVLLNDTDPEEDPITSKLEITTEHGDLNLKADGSVVYVPNKDFTGVDNFSYTAQDNKGESNQATVWILVKEKNIPPVAKNDTYYLKDSILEEYVSLNDSDPNNEGLAFIKLSNPTKGKVQFFEDGKFIYTPNPGFSGTDSFTYQTCDPDNSCSTATVIITSASDPDSTAGITVYLTPASTKIVEGKKASVTARLSSALNEDVFITLKYKGTATKERDYFLLEQFEKIKIPKGATTTKEKIVIAALNDNTNEIDEDLQIEIASVSNSKVQIGKGSEVIILDLYPFLPDKENETQVDKKKENAAIQPDPLVSANGDGLGRDYFHVGGIDDFSDNEVRVFNRWGNEVYSVKNYSNGQNAFKGIANKGLLTNSNMPLVEGVYYYLIYTTDNNNERKLNKGYLILKR